MTRPILASISPQRRIFHPVSHRPNRKDPIATAISHDNKKRPYNV
jgi:hypothetical protein